MYKVIIWGTGNCYDQNINLIKYQEMQKNLHIQAVTSNTKGVKKLDGYPFVPL